MAGIRFTQSADGSETAQQAFGAQSRGTQPMNWTMLVAGAALVSGGVLLLTGRRRAGMVAAAAGTGLALLEEQETLRAWWELLPGYIDGAQRMIGQVQGTVGELAVSREKLAQMVGR